MVVGSRLVGLLGGFDSTGLVSDGFDSTGFGSTGTFGRFVWVLGEEVFPGLVVPFVGCCAAIFAIIITSTAVSIFKW